MKTDVSSLPPNKQAELSKITTVIKSITGIEMVILFGSYARGDWVEEKDEEGRYRYQSDFDLLVIVGNKNERAQSKYEHEIQSLLEKERSIKTPVSIIVHDIEFVNKRLKKAQYFFTDIKREGIMLYDSQQYQLSESKELLPQERKRLAQEDFEYWFTSAKEFQEGFEFFLTKKNYKKAVFLLHQATEQFYSTVLLVFTRYKPNTHDLEVLRKFANLLDNRLSELFPLDSTDNCHLFNLLRKAYVDARYKPSYQITEKELLTLSERVKHLQDLTQLICNEKIKQFSAGN